VVWGRTLARLRTHIKVSCSRYDDLSGLYPQFGNDSWAQKTLQDHAGDVREHVYSAAELELGRTHDALWNAAQLDMVRAGKSACVLHCRHSLPC